MTAMNEFSDLQTLAKLDFEHRRLCMLREALRQEGRPATAELLTPSIAGLAWICGKLGAPVGDDDDQGVGAAAFGAVNGFVSECVVPAPEQTVLARDLYGAYSAWCVANLYRSISETQFGKEMYLRFARIDVGRSRAYRDISLRKAES